MNSLDYLTKLHAAYDPEQVDKTLSPTETMRDEWYWKVGASAIDAIAKGCVAADVTKIVRILDLPCGHGRVLRHLVKFFPGVDVHACDVDSAGVEFCAKTFGAVPIRSEEELTDVAFPARYDLIWIGSLFTHTSREITQKWLAFLADQLTERGIIVATLHGRWCEYVYQVAPYIQESSWFSILAGYRNTGYGYADYARSETHDYLEGSYGVSLARPSTIIELVEAIPGVRIYSYQERGWADHQDVLVLGKPAFDKRWPNMTG